MFIINRNRYIIINYLNVAPDFSHPINACSKLAKKRIPSDHPISLKNLVEVAKIKQG